MGARRDLVEDGLLSRTGTARVLADDVTEFDHLDTLEVIDAASGTTRDRPVPPAAGRRRRAWPRPWRSRSPCSRAAGPRHRAGTPTGGTSAAGSAGSPTAAPSDDPLAGWSLAEQVGLLVMVGVPVDGSDPSAAVTAVSEHHVSTVFLQGRSTGGDAQVSAVLAPVAAAAGGSTHGLGLLVATDQEGGKVQVLRGPGFSTIPTALEQGELAPATLRADAAEWGRELAAAGVHLDLAPVAGVVPVGTAADNAPSGRSTVSTGPPHRWSGRRRPRSPAAWPTPGSSPPSSTSRAGR